MIQLYYIWNISYAFRLFHRKNVSSSSHFLLLSLISKCPLCIINFDRNGFIPHFNILFKVSTFCEADKPKVP